MSNTPALNVLIDVAHDAVDEAAQSIQKAAATRDKAQEQLDLLHSYRLDYAQRLQENAEGGLTASNYLNFHRFLSTLDEAISQQNNIVAQSESRLEAGRQQWYAEKRRLNAYEALHARQRQQRVRREAHREQRHSDELAANLFRRSNRNH